VTVPKVTMQEFGTQGSTYLLCTNRGRPCSQFAMQMDKILSRCPWQQWSVRNKFKWQY